MTEVSSQMGPFGMVPRWVVQATKGQPWCVVLYAVLADHADRSLDNGWTCSRESLAEEVGCSEPTVDRALAALVEAGAIVIERTRIGRRWGWSRFVVIQVRGLTGDAAIAVRSLTGDDTRSLTGDDVYQEPIIKNPSLVASDETDGVFEKFWKAYPRRVGTSKKKAKAAFKAAVKAGHLDHIRTGLKRDAQIWSDERRALEHIPHAATWLYQERYMPEDDGAAAEHPHTGRIFFGANGERYQVQADGSEILLTSTQ